MDIVGIVMMLFFFGMFAGGMYIMLRLSNQTKASIVKARSGPSVIGKVIGVEEFANLGDEVIRGSLENEGEKVLFTTEDGKKYAGIAMNTLKIDSSIIDNAQRYVYYNRDNPLVFLTSIDGTLPSEEESFKKPNKNIRMVWTTTIVAVIMVAFMFYYINVVMVEQ